MLKESSEKPEPLDNIQDYYFFEERIDTSLVYQGSIIKAIMPEIIATANMIIKALKYGKKVLIFGNGGSATDAEHMATELVVKLWYWRRPVGAIALTTSAVITAIANDLDYAHIFRRQIFALGRPGDVAIGISTSGKSRNVHLGLVTAHEKELKTVLIGGIPDPVLEPSLDVCMEMGDENNQIIQECHRMIIHIICECVEVHLLNEADIKGYYQTNTKK